MNEVPLAKARGDVLVVTWMYLERRAEEKKMKTTCGCDPNQK